MQRLRAEWSLSILQSTLICLMEMDCSQLSRSLHLVFEYSRALLVVTLSSKPSHLAFLYTDLLPFLYSVNAMNTSDSEIFQSPTDETAQEPHALFVKMVVKQEDGEPPKGSAEAPDLYGDDEQDEMRSI